MKCPHCNSDSVHKNGVNEGVQQYGCNDCKKYFNENTKHKSSKPRVGMSIDQFREKHDVDYILSKVLDSLDKDTIYERGDIYSMTGLSASYPGLGAAIENSEKYYGKISGKLYFSHPDTITGLKDDAKLK